MLIFEVMHKVWHSPKFKLALKVLRSIGILFVLAVLAGVATVYIQGRTQKPKPAPAQPAVYNPPSMPQPRQIAANAPEGVAIQGVSSPVTIGSQATLQIKTNPSSVCTVDAGYRSGGHIAGLVQQSSDAYGTVIWNWQIDSAVPVGTWPLTIRCVYRGRSGVGTAQIQVTR